MLNIPVFTGEGGLATLILQEIPVKETAFVLVQSAWDLPGLLKECSSFCRMAGAAHTLVSGDADLSFLPHSHDLLRLKGPIPPTPITDLTLVPLTGERRTDFQARYRRLFSQLPDAATPMPRDLDRMIREASAYFIERQGATVGLGVLALNTLSALGIDPAFRGQGLGKMAANLLLSRLPGPEAFIPVSSDNEAALALYRSLGFVDTELTTAWYRLQ